MLHWALCITLPVLSLVVFLWFIRQPRPAKIPVKDRHVLVTGGSSGIGLEVAKLAAAEGARVSILARDPSRLAAAQREIAEISSAHRPEILIADVRNFDAVTKALEQAGPVDVLICSHGVSAGKPLDQLSLDEINDMIDINLKGCIHLIKAALPSMQRRNRTHPASIAIFSSQAGQTGLYGYSAYSASKFALRGLAETLQQELIPYNIRISLIYPPDTYTPGFLKENEIKSDLTKALSGSSVAMDAKSVGRISLEGIKSGQFCVSCNFDGFMLSIVTAGMSPQPSLGHAFCEVLFGGILRVVAFCVLWGWYRKVATWPHTQNKQKHL